MAVRWIDRLPWWLFVLLAVTLGLAPFGSEPHVWEKMKLLANGELSRAIDIFDLVLHTTPWALLLIKLYCQATARRPSQ